MNLQEKATAAASSINLKAGGDECNACCSLIATSNIRLRTMILSFLFFVASFVYYGLSLNQSSVGGEENKFLTFTLYGIMEIPALIFAMITLLCFGRRLPIVFLYLSAGTCPFPMPV